MLPRISASSDIQSAAAGGDAKSAAHKAKI